MCFWSFPRPLSEKYHVHIFPLNNLSFMFLTSSVFNFAGVAGGAASGKTTVCDMIIEQLRDQRVVLVNQVWSLQQQAKPFGQYNWCT